MENPYLVVPSIPPVLDPGFRPAILARRAFARDASVPVRIALEQADGSVFHAAMAVLPEDHPNARWNAFFVERFAKFLLWSWGGWRIWIQGPPRIAADLQRHYLEDATGRFDSEIIGQRIYDHPITVVATGELPPARSRTTALGRHLEGCRIGFDLGGSDRKVAALRDGEVVFSEEIVWDPYFQKDPAYHHDGIMDSLRRGAAHLPRGDALGGGGAGGYGHNPGQGGAPFRGGSAGEFERGG
ncbi:MAG: ROK family protein, partial [Verrucomicrobia bacterium]